MGRRVVPGKKGYQRCTQEVGWSAMQCSAGHSSQLASITDKELVRKGFYLIYCYVLHIQYNV